MVSHSQIVDLVKISLKKEGIREPCVAIIGHLESEGYISNAISVKASGKMLNGSPKEYNLIVKYVKDTEVFRDNNDVKRICKSEFHFYKNVVPVFNNILEQNGLDEFVAAPKCYGCYDVNDVYVIILEHLGKVGFKVQDKKRPLDINHVKLLLREHGKMHAVSMALKIQQVKLYEKLIPRNSELFDMSIHTFDIEDYVNKSTWTAIDSIKDRDIELYDKTCRLFEKLPCDIYMDLMELSGSEEKTVLNHGDCWNDNYLFKYETNDETRPSEAMLIDFQSAQVHSPLYDVSNMIYSVSESKLDHFGELLKSYHESLQHYLERLGCDPNLFTFDDLKGHWKKYALRGLIVAMYTMKVIIAVKPAAGDDQGFLGIIVDENQQELYYQRVRLILLHYFASMEIIDTIS